MNITEIFKNEKYSDELVLIAVKHSIKQRKLRRKDLAFLKEVVEFGEDEFTYKLGAMLPLSNPYWRLPSTKTQMYLRRKRRENKQTKR